MERERLSQLVKDADLVDRGDLADLNDLARRFPWFAGAQLLRTVGEHSAGDVLSDEVVHRSASHLPSRTVLFDRIAAAPVLKVVANEPPAQPRTLVPEPATETTLDPTVVDEIPEGSLHSDLEGQTVETPVIAPEVVPPPRRQIVTEEAEIETDETSIVEEPDPLDTLIRQAVKVGGYDITAPTGSDIPPPPLTATDQADQIIPVPKTGKRSFTDWLSEAPAPIHKPIPEDRSGVPSISADWLRALAADKGSERTLPESVGQQLSVFESETTVPAEQLIDERTPRKRPIKPADTVDLIDRFIREQDPPQPKAPFYTPQQAAKRSLDDSGGMVTETLAKVYVKQGNLPKAISTYQKLALKFPEKSAFFAALAKELEVQQHK